MNVERLLKLIEAGKIRVKVIEEKAAIFGYAAFLIYVSMINHKSEIPQYRFSIEAPEK